MAPQLLTVSQPSFKQCISQRHASLVDSGNADKRGLANSRCSTNANSSHLLPPCRRVAIGCCHSAASASAISSSARSVVYAAATSHLLPGAPALTYFTNCIRDVSRRIRLSVLNAAEHEMMEPSASSSALHDHSSSPSDGKAPAGVQGSGSHRSRGTGTRHAAPLLVMGHHKAASTPPLPSLRRRRSSAPRAKRSDRTRYRMLNSPTSSTHSPPCPSHTAAVQMQTGTIMVTSHGCTSPAYNQESQTS